VNDAAIVRIAGDGAARKERALSPPDAPVRRIKARSASEEGR
jgi:hypothetical protein